MPTQDIEDVKNFEETVKVDDTETEKEEEETKEESEEESSEEEETEEKDDEESKEEEEKTSTEPSPEKETTEEKSEEKVEPLKDGTVETPRERALRLKVERLQGEDRKKKADDLLDKPDIPTEKKEISQDKKDRLAKFDAEEVENLREILEVMGDELGFVKKDEHQKSSYETQAKDALEDFLEEHPEYSPENDKGDILWNRFKSEFEQYKKPDSPRGLKKLFKKIHNEVVGIKPASDLRKIEAGKEKIESASHSASKSKSKNKSEQIVDSSKTTIDRETAERGLKGFSKEEMDDLLG